MKYEYSLNIILKDQLRVNIAAKPETTNDVNIKEYKYIVRCKYSMHVILMMFLDNLRMNHLIKEQCLIV